eukprot:CAMPEP_0170093648 /NCGR_PEP_ID=MMETSP0019_2-20121128/26665_1 /TAXON_ID=98059 /ORGANISM="Dinobryon sp., Strain UTEXLB2267" /LENGTH=40 /DNA_ID= /DNA_START= /DNA_END= /DNA_ORIENTATION=
MGFFESASLPTSDLSGAPRELTLSLDNGKLTGNMKRDGIS